MRILLAFILLALLPGLVSSGSAQIPGEKPNYVNGHNLLGLFYNQYYSVPDPYLLYGYPITDEFEAMLPTGMTRVQYFQKARFDLVRTENGTEKIVIAELGSLIYPGPGPLAPVPSDGPTCRKFATGKSVCFAFLQFFDANNGAANFGNPISDLEIAEGRYVQYFERARMEWRIDNPDGQHVVLTDLGRRYFDLVVDNDSLLAAVLPVSGISAIEPAAKAFVAKALIPANSQQTLFVIVHDQYMKPVPNAQVTVFVVTPDGKREPYRAPETNQDGISKMSFSVGNYAPQQVIEVDVEISAYGATATAESWFRVWY